MIEQLSKINRILIPIDFSETSLLAIEHGGFMAKLFKAEIILAHIVEQHYQQFNIVAPEIKFEIPSDLVTKLEEKLKDLAEKIRKDYGVVVTTICSEGTICDEIVSLSNSEKVDLIVMGTHGLTGLSEMFMGSNAYRVVTLSAIPVLTVHNHSKRIGFSDILLPIDNSKHSRQKVVPVLALAKQYGSRIHLLGLLDDDDRSDREKFNVKINQVKEFITKAGIPVSVHIKDGGNLAKNTLAAIQEFKAELVVIMTDQEENFTGSFIGPYAQQVVNHSPVPVLSFMPIENEGNLAWTYPYN